jgi:hypothetical protein
VSPSNLIRRNDLSSRSVERSLRYTHQVRQILSIFLVLLIGFPLVAPMFAAIPEANLPACCRKNGAHHCDGMAMEMMHAAPSGHVFSDAGGLCPFYPKSTAAVQLHPVFLASSQVRFADVVAHPTGQPQTEARYRIAYSRSRQKRGPPVILS